MIAAHVKGSASRSTWPRQNNLSYEGEGRTEGSTERDRGSGVRRWLFLQCFAWKLELPLSNVEQWTGPQDLHLESCPEDGRAFAFTRTKKILRVEGVLRELALDGLCLRNKLSHALETETEVQQSDMQGVVNDPRATNTRFHGPQQARSYVSHQIGFISNNQHST